jgi:hypothetical protein
VGRTTTGRVEMSGKEKKRRKGKKRGLEEEDLNTSAIN